MFALVCKRGDDVPPIRLSHLRPLIPIRDLTDPKLIGGCVDHILKHRGPDEDGYAHPVRKQIQLEDLEQALAICHRFGLSSRVQPFFFKGVNGLFKRSDYGKDLVTLGVKYMVDSTYTKLARLVKVARAKMFMAPFEQVIDGKTYLLRPSTAFFVVAEGSPIKACNFYLDAEELHRPGIKARYEHLAGYHFPDASKGYFSVSESISPELAKARSGALLFRALEQRRAAPGMKLRELVASFKSDTLVQPFIDQLDGEEITVSLHAAVSAFGSNVRDIAQHYLTELRRREPSLQEEIDAIDLDQILIRSRHSLSVKGQPSRVWKKEACGAAMWRRIDDLIALRHGTFTKLLKVVRSDDLRRPLPEIRGKQASLERPFTAFDQSPFKVVWSYIEQRDLREPGFKDRYKDLRPYHLATCSLEFYSKTVDGVVTYNLESCREVAFKKIDQLIATKYRSLANLVAGIEHPELTEPLLDIIDGETFEVPTTRALLGTGKTVFDVLRAYIDHQAINDPTLIERYKNFRKFHLKRCTRCCFSETVDGERQFNEDAAREALSWKIGDLLKAKYATLIDLMCGTTGEELKTPFLDTLDGVTVEVSMSAAHQVYGNQLWTMLEAYHCGEGLPFPYTRLCFVGPPDARRRRILGTLSRRDITRITSASGEIETSRYGFTHFNGVDKADVVDLMFDFARGYIPAERVRYLGLETEVFNSIRAAQRHMSVSSITVVERDARVAAAMGAIAKLDAAFRGVDHVTIRRGDINDLIPHLEDEYDLCFLDYVGHLSKGKETAIRTLFEKSAFSQNAVFCVTLQDSSLARNRMQRAGYSLGAFQNLTGIVSDAAVGKYRIVDSFDFTYPGGINSEEGSGMVCCGFALESLAGTAAQLSFRGVEERGSK